MHNLPQWINWREEPPDVPGDKPKKVPCDLTTGYRIDPHAQGAPWLSHDEACRRDPEHVGFVLTGNDPYFCIDLDHAYQQGAWSPAALDTLARFPGAYVEVSYSNDGLHIIAQGTPPEGYKTRGPGVELYTQLRLIAITGRNATGSPDVDHTAALAGWCPLYLKPADLPAVPGGEWRDGPVPEATPIPDDDALISKMLAARPSAGVAFQGKASAADLWNANAEALGASFPDPNRAYDASAADAALAAHLAFWTGKDHERIARLMRRSALARTKWDDHASYLTRTVQGAAARVSKVYQHPAEQPAVPEAAAGYQYMPIDAQREHFQGCCYVIGQHRVLMPNGMLLKPEAFRAAKAGYEFEIGDRAKPTKNAFEAFTENRMARFPKADATCFRPEHPSGALIAEGGLTLVNTYVPAPVDLGTGDVGPFLDHLRLMLPDEHDRAILIAYLAAMRQYPGRKFFWCPLIQGVEGNGKGVLTDVAEYLVGSNYTHKANAKELGDGGAKFTGWLDRKLLVIVEEIYVSDRREVLDALKPLITDRRVEIQRKGVDQVTADNRANFILTSNHKDAIIKTRNDRRYAIFYTAQQSVDDLLRDGMGEHSPYWRRLWSWLHGGGLADVAGYLQRYTIPDELNPATVCHRAPRTSSTDDAIRESRGVVEQSILEAIDEERPGFAGGWVSSIALSRLLDSLRRTVPPRKRGELMESLGYVQHPALHDGRVPVSIMQEDMKRPRLYVLKDSINFHNLHNPHQVLHNYLKAQGYVSVNYGTGTDQ